LMKSRRLIATPEAQGIVAAQTCTGKGAGREFRKQVVGAAG
jgi:hypothetical protein